MSRASEGPSTQGAERPPLAAQRAPATRNSPSHRPSTLQTTASACSALAFALVLPIAVDDAFAQLRELPRATPAASSRPNLVGSIDAALARPVSFFWEKVPAAQGIERLTAANPVSVVLDRRIDPSAPLTGQLKAVPLGEALQWIAGQAGAKLVRVGRVLYVGPSGAAAKIRTIVELHRQDLGNLSPERQAQLQHPYTVAWQDLADPPEILGPIAKHYGLELQGAEQLPIDLWRAGRFEDLAAVELLTLVLVQFDMDFTFDATGRAITLRLVADHPVVERQYAVEGQAAGNVARTIARRLPGLEVAVRAGRLIARGSIEEHEQLVAMLGLVSAGATGYTATVKAARGPSTPRLPAAPGSRLPARANSFPGQTPQTPHAAKAVYSLRLRNKPLTAVLAAIEKQAGVRFDLDLEAMRRANIAADSLVSLEASQVSLDELLGKLLMPLGLTYERQADVYHVKPR